MISNTTLQGLFYVDDSPTENHFHMLESDVENMIFPPQILQLMTTTGTDLRQYYEDAMYYVLKLDRVPGVDIFEYEFQHAYDSTQEYYDDPKTDQQDRELLTFSLADCKRVGTFLPPS